MCKDQNQLNVHPSQKIFPNRFLFLRSALFSLVSFSDLWLPLRVFSNQIFRSGLGFRFRGVGKSKAKWRFVVAMAVHQGQSFWNASTDCSCRKLFFWGIDSGFLRGEAVLTSGDGTKSCRCAFCFDGRIRWGRRGIRRLTALAVGNF